jgi:NACalpha-BTF3-like transcription factor
MAAVSAHEAGGEEEEEEKPDAADVDKTTGEQGKALDTLTDVVEERQMSNSSKVQEAMARLIAEEEERAKALRAREKELAAVKLNDPADVELVASELELEKKVAERRLREHGGDVLQALRTFLRE